MRPPPRLLDRRVVVTGLGLVTPLGVGVSHVWRRLLDGDVGVTSLTAPAFARLPCLVAAQVPRGVGVGDFNAEKFIDRAQSRSANVDFIAFALGAAAEAARDAGMGSPSARAEGWPHARERVGVSVGCGIGGLGEVAAAAELLAGVGASSGGGDGLRRLSPFFVPRILANMAAGHVGIAWGLHGPCLSASTACASGSHAVGEAYRTIRVGAADAMLAGGSEACVHPLALAGFGRARALSGAAPEAARGASRPFDTQRDGFVLGEGAGMMVLEEREAALRRGAVVYAELRGYGASADAVHITSPAEDGGGATRSMRAALAEAGVHAEDVAYVNAHATGTPAGDIIEARAIDAVLAEGGRGEALVGSTKGAIGHLLGAAGAVEAVLAVLALHSGLAPPSVNLLQPDYTPTNYRFVPGVATTLNPARGAAISNSFGFGGTCSSLVFGREGG